MWCTKRDINCKGTVKYIGCPLWARRGLVYYGLELGRKKGTGDGTKLGVQYFKARAQRGVYVLPKHVAAHKTAVHEHEQEDAIEESADHKDEERSKGDSNEMDGFLLHLSLDELQALQVGDKIDHYLADDAMFYDAEVAQKEGDGLVWIRYSMFEACGDEYNEWCDCRKEQWRFAQHGSASLHRLRPLIFHKYAKFFSACDIADKGAREATLLSDLNVALEAMS